jgi:hypothetical protein
VSRVQGIWALAKGGGRDFARETRVCVPHLLGLLREKKPQIDRKIHETLDVFVASCVEMDTLIPDIQTALSNAVAKVRLDTLSWLLRWFVVFGHFFVCRNPSVSRCNGRIVMTNQQINGFFRPSLS